MMMLAVLMTLALTAFAPKSAQAAPYCMTDVYGYVWNMNVTPAGGNVFNFGGFVNVDGVNWSISGTFNRGTNSIVLTATNPSPDGCVSASSFFTYTGSRTGGSGISFSWTNDCGGSGTGTGNVVKGSCRVGHAVAVPNGPAAGRKISAQQINIGPNPAADMINLSYTLTESTDVNIQILDMSGREVAVLAQGAQDAGTYQLSWNLQDRDGSALANGLYLVRFNNLNERLVIQR